MKNLLIIILVLSPLFSFSQKVVIDKKDTMICFTSTQSKFLLKQVTKLEFIEQQDSLNQLVILEQAQIIQNQTTVIETKDNIISNNNEINLIRDQQLAVKESELDESRKDFRKQKRQKNLALIGGGILGTVLTTLLILK